MACERCEQLAQEIETAEAELVHWQQEREKPDVQRDSSLTVLASGKVSAAGSNVDRVKAQLVLHQLEHS